MTCRHKLHFYKGSQGFEMAFQDVRARLPVICVDEVHADVFDLDPERNN